MDYDALYLDDRIGKPKPKHEKIKHSVELIIPPLPDSTDIRDRAKAVEDQIFMTYYELMTDPEGPASVRKACADALADRARGKPSQSVEVSGKLTLAQLVEASYKISE